MRWYLSLVSSLLIFDVAAAVDRVAINVELTAPPVISNVSSNMPLASRISADKLVGKWHFYIQKYETSCEDYLIWLKSQKNYKSRDENSAEYECELSSLQPVTTIDWHTANQYCNDRQGRLPTEYEWVVAASINTAIAHQCYKKRAKGVWVSSTDILLNNRDEFLQCVYQNRDEVFFEEIELSSLERQKLDVLNTIPGINGTYGMQGNVWEWTSTRWQPPGIIENNIDYRVIKGGAFTNGRKVFLNDSQWRNALPANIDSYGNVGFRCAWDVGE